MEFFPTMEKTGQLCVFCFPLYGPFYGGLPRLARPQCATWICREKGIGYHESRIAFLIQNKSPGLG